MLTGVVLKMELNEWENAVIVLSVGLSKIMIVFKYVMIISIYYDYNMLSAYSKNSDYR
jgi:hypothetical protein